jgi:hypothetical protein
VFPTIAAQCANADEVWLELRRRPDFVARYGSLCASAQAQRAVLILPFLQGLVDD